jgi:glycine oxidase
VTVTIVGGGVIGYSIAYELATRGIRVVVIDARGAGAGATRASAGILAPYIEGREEAVLRLGVRSLSLYDQFIERVTADARQPIEWQRCGTIEAACNSEQDTALEAAAVRLAAAGVAHRLLAPRELRQAEPALDPDVTSALRIDEHGYVRVSHLMSALVTAVRRMDGEHRHQTVERIASGPAGVRVETSDGASDVDAVVIAAGTWSGLVTAPPAPVRPIRGQVVELACEAAVPARVVWGDGCYVVPWRDGRVLVGATSEDAGFDESVVPAATTRLTDAARALIPGLRTAVVADVRVGLRPATPDELPIIGPSATLPGVFFATGHYRHGILMAPLTASMTADLVTAGPRDPLLDLVRPARFGL